MSYKEKMKSGKLYYMCEEMAADQNRQFELLYDYNHCRPSEQEKLQNLLKALLAEVGEGCFITPPFNANWGCNTHMGNNVYANFGLCLVDDTDIYIGDNVMFGPYVVLATAGHPVHPPLRAKQAQFNLPIRIENNVWLGANVCVMPGVTIGENSVIGAGSVVTRDIPPGVVAVGNPCRVLREIGEKDKEFYHKDLRVDIE